MDGMLKKIYFFVNRNKCRLFDWKTPSKIRLYKDIV